MKLFGSKSTKTVVYAPASGKLKTLKSLEDGVFSEKMMGSGVVIVPQNGQVYAPISGVMSTVFHTGHAYGITSKKGAAILVHIGLDTVNLNGEGFVSKVKQGQKVKAGDLICEFDLALVSKKAPSANLIVIATTDTKGTARDFKQTGTATLKTEIFTIS